MDEYYCPECGATLDDQYGFDPSAGTWTCTECGQLLMDDDIYEGDSYEGVAWFCDGCGTLLNRQSGFSDSYGSWVCTECGCQNGTTEDDIIDESSPCPVCGARLKDQWCYSEWQDDWECTECGAKLHRDCSMDPYEVVDADDGQERAATYYSPQNPSSFQSNKTKSYTTTSCISQSESELRKKRVKAFFFKRKRIAVGYDSSDLLRRNIDDVATLLYNQAFNNIKRVPLKDIYVNSPYSIGQIEGIVINGNSCFRKYDLVPYDAEIVITYHVKREITLPFSEKALRKMNYVTAGDKLQELGFTKIYERAIRDLVTGWITKDGAVEKITIGNVYPFKKNSTFTYDTEILIEYHTFRKRRE